MATRKKVYPTRSVDGVLVNRAPVMALWAAVVAERLGQEPAAALTLGQAVSALNARSKGRRLGIYEKHEEGKPKPRRTRRKAVEVLGRSIPVSRTKQGIRAVVGDETLDPDKAAEYLQRSFGENLQAVRELMTLLASRLKPEELQTEAYKLYEEFRPAVPAGTHGWGAKGELDLKLLVTLAERHATPAGGH